MFIRLINCYIFILVIIILSSGCDGIQYKSDLGFLSSAQANSPEFLVRLNGILCKDVDNQIGLCAKRISSDQDLILTLDPRPYNYRLQITCTNTLGFEINVDIPAWITYAVKIPKEKVALVPQFTCIGEVYPRDRPQTVSAVFQMRVVVVDKNYIKRESSYVYTKDGKNYAVYGEHAKHVSHDGKYYNQKPVIEINSGIFKGYSESEVMRFNYYGL